MTIIATSGGEQSYPKIPTGVHNARCIKVIDLGTQRQDYAGEISWKRQILVIWEVPEQLNNDQPMTISKFYTLSLHEKANLGMDLTSWRGRPFTETEKLPPLVPIPAPADISPVGFSSTFILILFNSSEIMLTYSFVGFIK